MNAFTIIPDRITPKLARELGFEIKSHFVASFNTSLWSITRKDRGSLSEVAYSSRSRKQALDILRQRILSGQVTL